MKTVTIHIPRYFPYKTKLLNFINTNGLTIKHINERFLSLYVYGSEEMINKLLDYIKEYNNLNKQIIDYFKSNGL